MQHFHTSSTNLVSMFEISHQDFVSKLYHHDPGASDCVSAIEKQNKFAKYGCDNINWILPFCWGSESQQAAQEQLGWTPLGTDKNQYEEGAVTGRVRPVTVHAY